MAYVFDPINNTLIDDEDKSLGNKFALNNEEFEKLLKIPGVFRASEAPQPPVRPDVQEIEAINRFMRDNPVEKAEGGRVDFDKGSRAIPDSVTVAGVTYPNKNTGSIYFNPRDNAFIVRLGRGEGSIYKSFSVSNYGTKTKAEAAAKAFRKEEAKYYVPDTSKVDSTNAAKFRKFLRKELSNLKPGEIKKYKDLKELAKKSKIDIASRNITEILQEPEFEGKVTTPKTEAQKKGFAKKFRDHLIKISKRVPKNKKLLINLTAEAKKLGFEGDYKGARDFKKLQNQGLIKNLVVSFSDTQKAKSNAGIIRLAEELRLNPEVMDLESPKQAISELATNIYGDASPENLKAVSADAARYAEHLTGIRKVDGLRILPLETRGNLLSFILDDTVFSSRNGANSAVVDAMNAIRDSLVGDKPGTLGSKVFKFTEGLKKGYDFDHIAGISATYENAPGYSELGQVIKSNINRDYKKSKIDIPFSRLLNHALGNTNKTSNFMVHGKTYNTLPEAISAFNDYSKNFQKKYNVDSPILKYEPGKKLNAKNYIKYYDNISPGAKKNIDTLASKGIVIQNKSKPIDVLIKEKYGSTLTNRLNSGIPIDNILSTIANDLNIPIEQVKNVAGKTLRGFGKAAVVLDPMFAAADASKAFTEGASGKEAANYVVGRFFEGLVNLPALAKGGFDFVVDKARGEDAKFEMPYEATFAQDYLKNVLEQTPKEVLEARKAQLEFDQNVLPGMTMVDDIDIPASKAEIEAARDRFMDEKGVDLSVLDEPKPDKTFNQFLANGGRAGFSNGGAAGADENFAAELEYFFTNPDAELPKMQTYKETMNPIEVLNDIIDPRNYAYYADVLARSGLRIAEFAGRILPATGKLVSDLIQKPAFKITGTGNNYVQDYTDILPSNIRGTGIFSEFLENITPTTLEKKVGLDKLIEAEEQKQIDRGSTVGPKVFADTVGLGAEVTAPIFPGLKLLNSFAKARNLPNDKATQKILEKEVDKVLSERGMTRREFLQATGASATVVMAKMLGLMDVAPKAAKVARAAPIMDNTVQGMPAWFKDAVYAIERKGLLKSRGDMKGVEPDFFEITLDTKLGKKKVLMSKNDTSGEITLDWTTNYYDTDLPVTITYRPGQTAKQNLLEDPEYPQSVRAYDVEVEAPEFEYKTVDVESMGPEDVNFDSAVNLDIKEEADAVVEALEDLGLGLTKKQKKDAADNFRYYNNIELDEGSGPDTKNPIDENDVYRLLDEVKRNK